MKSEKPGRGETVERWKRQTDWLGEDMQRREAKPCGSGEANGPGPTLSGACFDTRDVASPNDPKLSDCGARRAGCGKAAGAGWAKAAGWRAAASVTRGAVRCSAWLAAVATEVFNIIVDPVIDWPVLAFDTPIVPGTIAGTAVKCFSRCPDLRVV